MLLCCLLCKVSGLTLFVSRQLQFLLRPISGRLTVRLNKDVNRDPKTTADVSVGSSLLSMFVLIGVAVCCAQLSLESIGLNLSEAQYHCLLEILSRVSNATVRTIDIDILIVPPLIHRTDV